MSRFGRVLIAPAASSAALPSWAPRGPVTFTPSSLCVKDESYAGDKFFRVATLTAERLYRTDGCPTWARNRAKQVFARYDSATDTLVLRLEYTFDDGGDRREGVRFHTTLALYETEWTRFQQSYTWGVASRLTLQMANRTDCSDAVDVDDVDDYEPTDPRWVASCAADMRDPVPILNLARASRKLSREKIIRVWRAGFP